MSEKNVSWRDSLPADLQSNASIQDIQSIDALTKQFIDTKAMVGNSIRVPGKDAPAEDMQNFRKSLMDKNLGLVQLPGADDAEGMRAMQKQLGLPDEAGMYSRPDKWGGMSDNQFGKLTAAAHKAGISKAQFAALTGEISASDNEAFEAATAQFASNASQLKGEWGNAYDQKIARAANLAKQTNAPQDMQDAIANGTAKASDLRWFDSMAEQMSGEGLSLVKEKGGTDEHTPTELNEQIQEITRNMMSMDASDPRYKGLMDKRVLLAGKLKPGNS